jgi:hypothetical protein
LTSSISTLSLPSLWVLTKSLSVHIDRSVRLLALLDLAAVPIIADDDVITPPPFGLSSFAAEGRVHSETAAPVTGAAVYGPAVLAPAALGIGTNTNIIGSSDVTQQATKTVGTTVTTVQTCNPGKQTAQNDDHRGEPDQRSSLVAGANDYRLYEPTENRYDGSGSVYRSTDGTSWTAGFLPGLVRANSTSSGPYESAGDPSAAAGPTDTFWYANLAFNRSGNANAVAVSRSTNQGASWSTSFVIQTSAAVGATLLNDKEWVGADPSNSSNAYVTWTQFKTTPDRAHEELADRHLQDDRRRRALDGTCNAVAIQIHSSVVNGPDTADPTTLGGGSIVIHK